MDIYIDDVKFLTVGTIDHTACAGYHRKITIQVGRKRHAIQLQSRTKAGLIMKLKEK